MSQSQDIPPGREQLVRELARLPESERRAVVAAAEHVVPREKGPVLSWELLESAVGIVKGAPPDAVEDCDRLYGRC